MSLGGRHYVKYKCQISNRPYYFINVASGDKDHVIGLDGNGFSLPPYNSDIDHLLHRLPVNLAGNDNILVMESKLPPARAIN